eukprot:scaffold1744_cov340-Prasinococcus_capsulatus_cf.AAC.4
MPITGHATITSKHQTPPAWSTTHATRSGRQPSIPEPLPLLSSVGGGGRAGLAGVDGGGGEGEDEAGEHVGELRSGSSWASRGTTAVLARHNDAPSNEATSCTKSVASSPAPVSSPPAVLKPTNWFKPTAQ